MAGSTKLLINESTAETRIALLRGGQLHELIHCDHFGLRPTDLTGSIFIGRVKENNPQLGAAFIDLGGASFGFLKIGKREEQSGLSQGGSCIVQVTANGTRSKGPRVTSNISLQGRYVVFQPYAKGTRLSASIESGPARDRLAKIEPSSGGLIIRTAAEEAAPDAILKEVRQLEATWQRISENAADASSAKMLHDASTPHARTFELLSAYPNAEIVCDDPLASKELERMGAHRVEHYANPEMPLFEFYGVEDQIAEALESKVVLPGGAWMTIETTEALTAIDVNSGELWAPSGRESAHQSNRHAARKIAQQLRVRGIGGLVVIDFISMTQRGDRKQIVSELTSAMQDDPAHHQIGRFSAFGLLEMTRRHARRRLADYLMAPSANSGKSMTSIGYEVCRQLEGASRANRTGTIDLRIAHEVRDWFRGEGEDLLSAVKAKVPHRLTLTAEPNRVREAFEIIG